MIRQNNIKIRRFRKTDLADVRNLIYRTIDICYPDFYCVEAIKFFKDWHNDQKIIKNAKEGYALVIEKNNQIIGTGTIVGDEIMRVFVDPVFQKRDFGKLIMRELEQKAVSTGINVVKLDASLPSKKFYELLDYVVLEETFVEVENNKRLDYYKMEKSLIKKHERM
jgi:GNAT superfamily N-acetyltransferase